MTTINKCLFFLISLSCFSFGFLNTANAQEFANQDKGIIISPVKFEFDANPGETLTGTIKLLNATFSEKEVFLYQLNFDSDGVSGVPVFKTRELPYNSSLAKWIKLDNETVNILPVEPDAPNQVVVNFRIEIPQDATPGGHHAGIFATLYDPNQINEIESGNLAFKDERATLILVNVKGDITRELTIDSFYPTDAYSNKKPLIRLFEWMPVGFQTTLRNYGNSHTVPVGQIHIMSGETVVEKLDFNLETGNILRESSREFFNSWEGAFLEFTPQLDENGSPVRNTNGDIQVRFQINPSQFRMPLGQYTAKLVIGYQDGEIMKTLVSSTDFWVIPWKLILAVLIVSGFGVYLIYQQKNKKSKTKK